MDDLIEQARSTARNAYQLETSYRKYQPGEPLKDDLHHPGDDTGRIMWQGYEARGAAGAVDVLEAYIAEFERLRIRDGLPVLDPNDLAVTLGWAASVRANAQQIAEMRAEFCRRQNIADPAPQEPK